MHSYWLNLVIYLATSNEIPTLFQHDAISSIQQSVKIEMLAMNLIDEIKVY